MRTGRRPDADEICSVAALIEVEAKVRDPIAAPLDTHEPAIRAALHATGIPPNEFEDWLIELKPMMSEKGDI
jgi:hypothetical protein